jgi:hypothetical protein
MSFAIFRVRRTLATGSFPFQALFLFRMDAPQSQVGQLNLNDKAHPLGLGIENGVSKQAANVGSDQFVVNVEMNQTIRSMAPASTIEVRIEGKERCPIQLM